MPEDLIAWAPDPEGSDSYPIVTYTWLLCYKKYDDAKKAETVKKVVAYCLEDSQQQDSQPLGYIPLPANIVSAATRALDTIR